ncbi:MAG: Uncharacterised protein [SAR116 cluster bacterium]|jgi:photosystem II stability/assembly factor-like uncharacterized protein|nr:MAG: Uncharacterised protein [SAR116 cluster bacterium]
MKTTLFVLFGLLSFHISTAQQRPSEPLSEVLKYRNIGPFRGGRSVAASGVVGDPLTYYMGNTGGGVWKTTDAGAHWNNISDGFFNTATVGAIAVSESQPNVVYVGMGEHAPRGVMTTYGDGVYKSTDGGNTWVHLGLEKTQHISRIQIHPSNPDIVYVAAQGALHGPTSERGVYKSTDGGKSWTQQLFVNELTGASEISMDMNNPEVLYAAMWEHIRYPWQVVSGGAGSGLYKTSDGGAHWKKIHEGLPEEKGKMAIAVSRANSNLVMALIESDSNKDLSGLFVSKNAGESWDKVSGDNRLTQRAWYYIELFLDPNNEDTVYVMSAMSYKSIDGGSSWTELGGAHGDYHDLWINPLNSKNMVLADDGGAAISFDGGAHWSSQDIMPTAQFYRVAVDNAFPYHIYGGQQDNTSVKIQSMALGSGGIGAENWEASAGGESAFLAFDPNHPQKVMGGSYLGTIEILDTHAKAATQVMIEPIQYLGRPASDMKYRFNWNAPIVWAGTAPGHFYHGAQYVLKTENFGQSWSVISPDLSRNQKEKQGNGGGPYTNEAVGAENYGTLSYIAVSPHNNAVIYTASDDGLVHLSKDGGSSWENITPKGLPESLVNAIEVSPHQPSRVYVAVNRYKFNDHTPEFYVSDNYGQKWRKITKGIPYGSFARVLREDPVREHLLYAGTEKGVFISFDGGENWETFQSNLPNVAITDLVVKDQDLVVATMGRSFWILDGLELVRQYVPSQEIRLYKPSPAISGHWYSSMNGDLENFTGMQDFTGLNPTNGVVLYYHLPKSLGDAPISLHIKDSSGTIVHNFSSEKDPDYVAYEGAPSRAKILSKNVGLNRFVWEMDHTSLVGIPTAYIEASYRGHKAIPGQYVAEMHIGDSVLSQQVVILPNPNYTLSEADYTQYDTFMRQGEETYRAMAAQVNSLHAMALQIEKLLPKVAGVSEKQALESYLEELDAWDQLLIQRKSKAYDDVENFPNKFTAEYLYVLNQSHSQIPRITKGAKERMAHLNVQWKSLEKQASDLLEKKTEINGILWAAGIGALSQ